jgi:hypothetical protein
MKPEEKIERAYEELRAIIDGGSESFTHEDAVQYLKDKLAQPEQEPVAWLYKSEPSFDGNKWHDTFEVTTSKQVALWKDKSAKPLYTTPPQRTWVGLTEEEINEVFGADIRDEPSGELRFIRAIEAKLKEKNT